MQATQYEKLGKQEMMAMLKFGANAVFGGGNDADDEGGGDGAEMYTDEVLGRIIDRTTDWEADQEVEDADQKEEEDAGQKKEDAEKEGAGEEERRNEKVGGVGAAAGGTGGRSSPAPAIVRTRLTADKFKAEQVPLDFRMLHAQAVGLQAGASVRPFPSATYIV
jgi:hypothetical protein